MSNSFTPIFFPTPPHSVPLGGQNYAMGVMLCLVTPQPACRLVYSCMGDHCGEWGYPAKNVWEEWGDEDYRLPEHFEAEDRGTWWIPPCHVGDILPAPEPWAFKKCCDCYACETPQTVYRGHKGCFVYPSPQLKHTFHPAGNMPKEAARYNLLVERVQMMRLHKVPAEQYHTQGRISQDGFLFPENLHPIWDQTLSLHSVRSHGWEANPFVWVVAFMKRMGRISG